MDDTIKYIEEPNEIFQDKEYPLIPLRGLSVFPGMVLHFDVGRTKSINALEEAMADDQNVILVCQKNADADDPQPEDLYAVGTLAVVKQLLKMPGNVIRVLVEIESRALITEYIEQEDFFKEVFLLNIFCD